MPRNGSGQFSAITNSWNPAINSVPATAADWQAVLNDIVSALTQSVSRDGQTAMTGNLPMAGNKVTGLGNATATGDALTFAQLFSQGQQQDIASAATTDIGAPLTTLLNVTGTATITSFGTNYNGPRFLRFAGVCTLTNSATLVLPGGATITTAAGDSAIAVPLGNPATGWRVVVYERASGAAFDGSVTTNSIQNDAVTFAKMQDIPTGTILGRSSAGTGDVEALTAIRVDTNGNVGIGGSPASGVSLHVQGSINRIQGNSCSLGFSSPAAVNNWYVGANVSDTVNDGFHIGQGTGIGGTLRMRIDAGGNVTATGNITAGGQFIGNVTGNVTGNAGTVTNGVYTTGDQTIGGVKTFISTVSVSKQSGVDTIPGFTAATTGGAFAAMWARRGAPFFTVSETTGSSYAPALAHQYNHNSAFAGVYSVGVLNTAAASPGSFAVHHIDLGGGNNRFWEFSGVTGDFTSHAGIVAGGNITAGGQFIGNGAGLTSLPAAQLTGDVAAARIANALNATGSAPIYACRAWVNFNGTGTVAIRASGNVSSITDNGAGDYTVNFTTAMPDANYATMCNGASLTANDAVMAKSGGGMTTSSARVHTGVSDNPGFHRFDLEFVNVAIFR